MAPPRSAPHEETSGQGLLRRGALLCVRRFWKSWAVTSHVIGGTPAHRTQAINQPGKVEATHESSEPRHPCTRTRAMDMASWWRELDLNQRPPGNEPGEHSRLLYPAILSGMIARLQAGLCLYVELSTSLPTAPFALSPDG